jgi:aldehyde:ferredoxin oxidoreductase
MSKSWFGWAGRILCINLSTGEIIKKPLDPELTRKYLGQAGINAKLLFDLTEPGIDPLSPENPLIFGVGPLGGSLAPCSGRFTVTSKSPLTGIFGDSNCGGHWGPELKNAGYDHIIIKGKADKPVFISITDDGAQIMDAQDLWGQSTFQTQELIKKKLNNPKAEVVAIGPAGENQVVFAAVMHLSLIHI